MVRCSDALKEVEFLESTLETIDGALLDWIRNRNIHAMTKEGFKRVPIVWASAERSYQTKKYDDVRDETGSLIFPVISIQRTTVEKSLSKRLGIAPNTLTETNDYRAGGLVVARRINQEKSRNFANADGEFNPAVFKPLKCNEKVVYNTYTIPTPVYLNITYKIVFRTEYQQQINTLITPFMTYTGGINEFLIRKDGHQYPAFVAEQFNAEDNVDNFTEEERKFQVSLDIRVLGYIIGAGLNQESPKMVVRESIAEIRIPRERVLFGSIDDYDRNYGLGGLPRDAQGRCCPSAMLVPPRAFGSGLAGGGGVGSVINITNLTEVTNVVSEIMADILVFRDFLPPGVDLDGADDVDNLDFATNFKFKENSESLYFRGLIQFPGAGNDYVVWDGTPDAQGRPRPVRQGVTLVEPVLGGPPRTAAQLAAIAGGNVDDFEDDVLLISYIKD